MALMPVYFFSYHITSIISAKSPASPASPNCAITRPRPSITPKKSSNRIPTTIPTITRDLSKSVTIPSHSLRVSNAPLSIYSSCQKAWGSVIMGPHQGLFDYYPRNERKTSKASSPANPPSRNVFTKSTIPPIGSNPVE